MFIFMLFWGWDLLVFEGCTYELRNLLLAFLRAEVSFELGFHNCKIVHIIGIRGEGSFTSPRRDEELAGEASQLHHASDRNANDFVELKTMPARNPTGQGADLPVTMKALYVASVFFFVLLKNDNVSDTCLSKRC